ncbi:hypothetical protein SKAU_G00101980 [Synaphobranchus kaupii]|uniref:F-box domain-containing protein n=1 Tax=Synaphobranchus kaupii TaxID=118154 RepID=A0A9Q1J5C5_SYNKA|nr:hypothetical protein SKAU_G00101980 [Synaphobranchus kaupii]
MEVMVALQAGDMEGPAGVVDRCLQRKWGAHLHIYTDGSKDPASGRAGFAIHIPKLQIIQDDLIRASGVCQFWYEAAVTPWLWRQMCLQRWTFCNVARSECGKGTWKSYYLQRARLEYGMETGRSGADYTCRSLRGHTGSVVGLVYLVGNNADISNATSVVCSASTDGTVRAWDVQQGEQLWATPTQGPLCEITVDPKLGTLFTSDTAGKVSAWEGLSGKEVASFSTSSSGCKLLAYSVEDQSVLVAGTSRGSLHTLTSPSLSQLSHHMVFDTFKINLLISSPDKKWLFAGTQESSDTSPKVFSSENLSCPSEDESPLCQSFPVSGCCAAAFLPSEPARLVLIHNTENRDNNTVSVFNISMKKSKYKVDILVEQVETFQLAAGGRHPEVVLQTQGSDTLVVAMSNTLRVYTLKGVMLTSFEDHTQPITALCVDGFRVVTASRDLSLRVFTWKKERNKGRTLQSKFQLLGGSHTMSRGFTKVACDYVSIVASVQSVNGKDVLKAYSFNT